MLRTALPAAMLLLAGPAFAQDPHAGHEQPPAQQQPAPEPSARERSFRHGRRDDEAGESLGARTPPYKARWAPIRCQPRRLRHRRGSRT